MKRLACIAALLLTATTAAADPILPPQPISPVPVPTLRGPAPVLQFVDPAAVRMDLQLVSRVPGTFSGRVRITGVVKNLGTAPYISGANQQIVSIYEYPQGGRPRLVATRAFGNLAPGEETSVVFETNWYAGNEFPPSYKMMIVYDPDIRLDSNPKNDDANMSNNTRERTGYEINGLFH